ncbi:hypothetical protein TNIN_344391 [Trichonephila inaurata madagascariensis]|uniref:Uncharacterized protein n=1 Tax=Trichonephila inaurata madagascariensis TaxID=2747483 RepID=A0A8X7BY46_9ARAC|nr:hypothetical protein TNIN_344391 [Trichonephila inaurata madagascariensis]
MKQYDESTEINIMKKEDIPFVESTCIPFTVRFSNPFGVTKRTRHEFESRYGSASFGSNDIKRISYKNETFTKLSCRFSTYKDNTYDSVKKRFYNQKEAEFKLQNIMAIRRTVIPPNKKTCLLLKKTATSNILIESSINDHCITSNNVAESSSLKQNGIASHETSNSSANISKSLYSWKRKKVLTKQDLDKELDSYMSEIKLKEPYNQVEKVKEELEAMDFFFTQECSS